MRHSLKVWCGAGLEGGDTLVAKLTEIPILI